MCLGIANLWHLYIYILYIYIIYIYYIYIILYNIYIIYIYYIICNTEISDQTFCLYFFPLEFPLPQTTLGPNIDPIPWPRRLFLSKPLFVNPLVKIQSLMHEAIWASKLDDLDDLDGGSRGFAHGRSGFSTMKLGLVWHWVHCFCLYVCVKSVVVGSQFQTAGSWAGQLGIGVIWFGFTTPHQKY